MRGLTAARLAVAAAGALALACASASGPPGGPERHAPPVLLSVSPDSGEINVKIREVEFKFDEVVSDRPSGAGQATLDALFLVSPQDGAPDVSWHRSRITVKPRKGFRANTAYRITMLPGLADLRGNIRKEGMTILFATGATFPPFGVVGRVFDWDAQRPASGAYIEATPLQDTMFKFVTATDSIGQFDVGPFGAGTYRIRALIDQNGNRALDRNEKWDTTTVTVVDSRPTVELDAIERDTVPAVVVNVTVDDSVTLHLIFDKALDPSTPLQPPLLTIQRMDSSQLEVTRVLWASGYDRAKAAADSAARAAAAAADTTTRRPPPAAGPPPRGVPVPGGARQAPPPAKPKAPPPEKTVVVTVSPTTPLVPGQHYILTTRGFRNLVGRTGTVRPREFSVPRPVQRDTTKRAPADTTRRPTRPPPLRER